MTADPGVVLVGLVELTTEIGVGVGVTIIVDKAIEEEALMVETEEVVGLVVNTETDDDKVEVVPALNNNQKEHKQSKRCSRKKSISLRGRSRCRRSNDSTSERS